MIIHALLLMFRHGLRVGEAVGKSCGLRWDALMWAERQIFITREKGSDSGVHPLRDDELVLLKELREMLPDSKYIFVSECDLNDNLAKRSRNTSLCTRTTYRFLATFGDQ
ncbi:MULTISPECIES: tyrosine-type recombinase/integrase [unclassified Nostoc]|uniref:tyrosine-type recombinase/integrase n=1 Tax=unclassified Nostoc TaxID=2593658 RepID=UPI002892E0FD|nr:MULTISPECIES: tyrosine-type recombinase/integrase [unclassified Nostoc]